MTILQFYLGMEDRLKSVWTPIRTSYRWYTSLCPGVVLVGLAVLLILWHYEIPAEKLFPSQVHVENSSPVPARNAISLNPRVAICLVGGARSFELTGASIKKYLLQTSNNTDVFLHAPLDRDAYKFFLLKDVRNLVHVRIFTPMRLRLTRMHTEVLTANGSPMGIQGLLQYFNLVEGCYHMIEAYQSKHNFVYDWIVRTRADGYWNGPLPPLNHLNPQAYTVPYGSRFGGLNDRLGIGNWKTSKVALLRSACLPLLHSEGHRHLNSETAFMYQLKGGHINHAFSNFSFCILSHRSYDWPPGAWGVPVVSILSKVPMNGAKCRPCIPHATGENAKSILEAQMKSWAWIGYSDGLELCNPQHVWEENWEKVFDSIAGSDFMEVRKRIQNETIIGCINGNEEFRRTAEIWDAPSPVTICKKGFTF
eukprot:c19035_g1_i1 orf=369-1634(+)